MSYEVIVTTVRDRIDLLERTLWSLIVRLDVAPSRIIVHEDHRPRTEPPPGPSTRVVLDSLERDFRIPIVLLGTNPGRGLGQAMTRIFDEVKEDFVFYTQEDFDFLRQIPVAHCLEIMRAAGLNQVRFNKRKTLKIKGEDRPPAEQFHKLEVEHCGQRFCTSDAWCFQAGLWRSSLAREGFRAIHTGKGLVEPRFNDWLDGRFGGRFFSQPLERAMRHRTLIWGPVAEPAFCIHTGGQRRTQIKGVA